MLYIELEDSLGVCARCGVHIHQTSQERKERRVGQAACTAVNVGHTNRSRLAVGESWLQHFIIIVNCSSPTRNGLSCTRTPCFGARRVIFNMDEVMKNIIKDGMPALDLVLEGFMKCYGEKEDDEE